MPYIPRQHPYKAQPFVPRFNIPETFRESVSYEGQIHYLANLCYDAYEWTEHHKAYYWHYSTQDFSDFIDTDDPYDYGTVFDIELTAPLHTWERPGDIISIRIPCKQDGNDAVIFAELLPVNWNDYQDYSDDESGYSFSNYPYPDPRAESYPYKIKAVWLYAVRDYANLLESLEDRLTQAETNITNLQTRVNNLEARMETVENKVESLETTLQNIQNTINNMGTTEAQLTSYIEAIVNKLGGGTLNADGSITYNIAGQAAIGNLNIYSQTADPASTEVTYLRSHTGLYDSDIWFNNEES